MVYHLCWLAGRSTSSTHLESHYQVSKMKLCIQIQLDKNLRLSWGRNQQQKESYAAVCYAEMRQISDIFEKLNADTIVIFKNSCV